jgi:hypothetical protein
LVANKSLLLLRLSQSRQSYIFRGNEVWDSTFSLEPEPFEDSGVLGFQEQLQRVRAYFRPGKNHRTFLTFQFDSLQNRSKGKKIEGLVQAAWLGVEVPPHAQSSILQRGSFDPNLEQVVGLDQTGCTSDSGEAYYSASNLAFGVQPDQDDVEGDPYEGGQTGNIPVGDLQDDVQCSGVQHHLVAPISCSLMSSC